MNLRNGSIQIAGIKREQKRAVVYNITVANTHTYYISNAGALVHNCNFGSIGFAKGTAIDALPLNRLDHAARHLIGEVIPYAAGSKQAREEMKRIAIQILENPILTLDKSAGKLAGSKGFLGQVNGKWVLMYVSKTDVSKKLKQGQLATSVVVPKGSSLAKYLGID